MKTFVASLVMRFMDRLSSPARSAASALGSVERAQKMGARASEQWSRGLDQLDKRMNRLASASLVTDGMDRAGQAMMRPLAAASREAISFNSAMTGIGITADLTDAKLQPLRQTVLQTSLDLGLLPSKVQGTFGAVLAEGVYRTETELNRAGRSVATFQRLMAGMGEDLNDEQAGAYSAALGTSLKLKADQLDRANAMVLRSAKQGGVSGAVLARNLPAQTGQLAGLSFANDVGLADLLSANQIAKRLAGSSDQAANNVTNLFAALASPETIRKFGEVGVNLEQEIKKGIAAGQSPLTTLAETVRKITGGDQFRIGELFGDRQARDAIMALVQNLDDFKTMSAELRQDDVLVAYMSDLDRALKGPAASLGRYNAGIQVAGISTGTILAPAVGLAAEQLSRVAGWMSKASESGSWLAKAAVWAVAGLAGMAVAAGAVGHAVVGVLGPLYIARTLLGPGGMGGAAFTGAAARVIGLFGRMRLAALGFNLTMLANPVVLIAAAAVAAVVGVALVVRKYWEPIKAFFGGVGQALGEAFGPTLSAIGSMLAPLKPLWDGFAGGVGKVVGWFGRLLQPVKATDQSVTSAADAGRKFGRALAIAFQLSPVGLFIRGIRIAFNTIKAVMSWRPMDTLRSAWSGLTGFFGGLQTRFHGFGRMILAGLIAGIRSMLGGVQNAVMNTASSAVTWFKNRLGIRSPSRVFAGLGLDTMAGLAQGLTRGGRRAVGVVAVTAGAMTAAMTGGEVPRGPRPPEPPGAMAYSSAGGARMGGVHIETLTIHVTVQGGGDPRLGRQIGGDIAAELRRKLHDEG